MTRSNEIRAKFATILGQNPFGLKAIELSVTTKTPLRTAQRILTQLKKDGLVKTEGQGKNTVYKTTESDTIFYNEKFLLNLGKNEFLLSDSDLKKLDLMGFRSGKTSDLHTYNSIIYERLIIDLSWSSSFLEGNTYSLLETENLILKNQVGSLKDLKETQMILNHKEAIKFLVHSKKQIKFDAFTIKSVHALLSQNLLANPQSQGRIRTTPVGIEGTRYIPLDVPQKIEIEFQKMIKKANKINHPILQSFFIFSFLPYLQAFEDLNKRTARVCCNIPLISNNYIPISFLNIARNDYIAALKAIYERNDLSEIRSLFIKSYIYSVEKYKYIKQQAITPSPLAIKYRLEIKEQVHRIVSKNLAAKDIKTNKISKEDQNEFKKIIQQELKDLHIENLIRFDLSPAQFKKWKK